MSSLPGSLELAPASAPSSSPSSLWKDRVMPALLCAGLGLTLLYGAAFADTVALHNAAHDARHAASFPCH